MEMGVGRFLGCKVLCCGMLCFGEAMLGLGRRSGMGIA